MSSVDGELADVFVFAIAVLLGLDAEELPALFEGLVDFGDVLIGDAAFGVRLLSLLELLHDPTQSTSLPAEDEEDEIGDATRITEAPDAGSSAQGFATQDLFPGAVDLVVVVPVGAGVRHHDVVDVDASLAQGFHHIRCSMMGALPADIALVVVRIDLEGDAFIADQEDR